MCKPVIQLIYLLNRGGRGGGYKELDEEELEEIKRRRREAEEVKINWHIVLSCLFYSAVRHYFFLNLRMMVSCMMSLAI